MDITIDIECIPTQEPKVAELVKAKLKAPGNYKDPEKIAKYIEDHIDETLSKTALQPMGELVCIGCALDEEDPKAFTRQVTGSMGEKLLLQDWIAWLRSLDQVGKPAVPRFLGHNIIGFDIPRLWQRATVHGLVLPSYFPAPWEVSRWRPAGAVLDTMYAFSPEHLLSLEMLATMFGIEQRYPLNPENGKPITGIDVFSLWMTGEDRLIRDYCLEDVRVTREIAMRFLA